MTGPNLTCPAKIVDLIVPLIEEYNRLYRLEASLACDVCGHCSPARNTAFCDALHDVRSTVPRHVSSGMDEDFPHYDSLQSLCGGGRPMGGALNEEPQSTEPPPNVDDQARQPRPSPHSELMAGRGASAGSAVPDEVPHLGRLVSLPWGEGLCCPSPPEDLSHGARGDESPRTPFYARDAARSYPLHPVWTETPGPLREQDAPLRTWSLSDFSEKVEGNGDELQGSGVMQRFIMRPDSKRIIAWHLLSLACIAWDAFFMPMQGLPVPHPLARERINVMLTCYWTCDIMVSFFSGYWKQSYVEMRPHKVFRAYATSWFPVDILVAMMDWVAMLILSNVIDGFSLLRSIRILRLLRLFRMVRVVKVVSRFQHLGDYIVSEFVLTAVRVTTMVLVVLGLSHVIACAWYTLGVKDSYDSATWVAALEVQNERGASWFFTYTSALHWAVSQFTPASMEVVPQNELERLFSVVVILMGMVVFSSILSTITASMTHLRIMKTTEFQRRARLRAFFKQNQITIALSSRVSKFLRSEKKATARKVIMEKDVADLAALPEVLRVLLRVEVRLPTLVRHPLLLQVSVFSQGTVGLLCDEGLREQEVTADEKLVCRGVRGKHVIFGRRPGLTYMHCGSSMDLPPHAIVGEMVLWVPWTYRGTLSTAAGATEVFTLEMQSFHDIIARSPVRTQCSVYARDFGRYLFQCDEEDIQLSDFVELDVCARFAMKAFAAGCLRRANSYGENILRKLAESWRGV